MTFRRAFLLLLTLAYPALVYIGYLHFQPSALALLLAGLAILRALTSRDKIWCITAGIALVLAIISMVANQILPLKLYPALICAAWLVMFATSLLYPPTIVERIARRQDGPLSPEAIGYTRRVTQVWCGFFIVNGTLAVLTAIWGSNAVWALYNGCIAYVLMGLLFGAEWLIRQRVKARMTQ